MRIMFVCLLFVACGVKTVNQTQAQDQTKKAATGESTVIPVQPSPLIDGAARLSSWSSSSKTSMVSSCLIAVKDKLSQEGVVPEASFSRRYCGCIMNGVLSTVYSPTEPKITDDWVYWCTYAANKHIAPDAYLGEG